MKSLIAALSLLGNTTFANAEVIDRYGFASQMECELETYIWVAAFNREANAEVERFYGNVMFRETDKDYATWMGDTQTENGTATVLIECYNGLRTMKVY